MEQTGAQTGQMDDRENVGGPYSGISHPRIRGDLVALTAGSAHSRAELLMMNDESSTPAFLRHGSLNKAASR